MKEEKSEQKEKGRKVRPLGVTGTLYHQEGKQSVVVCQDARGGREENPPLFGDYKKKPSHTLLHEKTTASIRALRKAGWQANILRAMKRKRDHSRGGHIRVGTHDAATLGSGEGGGGQKIRKGKKKKKKRKKGWKRQGFRGASNLSKGSTGDLKRVQRRPRDRRKKFTRKKEVRLT